jgi:hypothetical protein
MVVMRVELFWTLLEIAGLWHPARAANMTKAMVYLSMF